LDASEAAKNALECVFEAQKGESVVIFCDDIKKNVGDAFMEGAQKLGLDSKLITFQTDLKNSRDEIPSKAKPFLTAKRPKIYINLLRGSREETPFRIKLIQLETSDLFNSRVGL